MNKCEDTRSPRKGRRHNSRIPSEPAATVESSDRLHLVQVQFPTQLTGSPHTVEWGLTRTHAHAVAGHTVLCIQTGGPQEMYYYRPFPHIDGYPYPYSYYLGTTSSTIRIPYPYYTEFSLILTWIQLLNTISQFLHESDWNSHCFCRFLRARWWVRITVKRIATG